MAPCYTCKRTVVLAAVTDRGFRFCSKACHSQKAALIASMAAVSDADIDAEVVRIRNGLCAKCGQPGNGAIGVHKSLLVWSAIFVTRMSEQTFIGCSRCARKEQALTMANTLVLGWWAVPMGLFLTPFALIANACHMIDGRSPRGPSHLLRDHARECLALGVGHWPPPSARRNPDATTPCSSPSQ